MLNSRFWDKVNVRGADDCWEWSANKNNKGYGMFRCRSLGFRSKQLAHRLSYAAANGPIEAGKVIMHTCDNPPCVNPAHLSVGTHADNMADASMKFRRPQQKYTADQITELLKDYVAGGLSRAELSAKHGVPLASLNDYTTGDACLWLHGRNGCPTTEQIRAARRTKPGAKIAADDVREIKRLLREGVTGLDIARQFGVHRATISDIKAGKTWRDVA